MVIGKKGNNILDVFFIVGMIFIAILAVPYVYHLFSNVNDQVSENFDSDVAKNATVSSLSAIENFDYLYILIFIGLILVTAISAFFIPTHPVFFIVSLILCLVFGLVVPIFSNVYESAMEQSSISSTASSHFSITSTFMDKLPVFFIVACALVFIALFAKWKMGGGSQL